MREEKKIKGINTLDFQVINYPDAQTGNLI